MTLLAAGVAHELGNPLNSLNIHLQLLERDLRRRGDGGTTDEELLESLRIARSEVSRLDTIISQFLGAVRPSQAVRSMVSINEVVRESLAFLEPEIKDRDVIVQEELTDGLPLIPANADQLKQAFYNLIKNAVQALSHGGILRVTTSRSDTHLQISSRTTAPASRSKTWPTSPNLTSRGKSRAPGSGSSSCSASFTSTAASSNC